MTELDITPIVCACGSAHFRVEFRSNKKGQEWVTATCSTCGKIGLHRELKPI